MIERASTWTLKVVCLLMLSVVPAQASNLTDLARSGDIAAVARALDNGAAVDEMDGVTALYVAVEAGNIDLAKLLIDRGADVNLQVKFKRTPLYGAATGGFAELVKLLLDRGADPNQMTKSQTALHFAADKGCLQCVIYLVEAGADVNALTPNGIPPVHFAVRNGHDDIVAFLNSHGASPPVDAPITARLATASISSGKEIALKKCSECHLLLEGERDIDRPNLWGIVGRAKGSESGARRYTEVLKNAGGTWTFEEINSFIAHPAQTLPGTEMSFEGLPDEQQRADVIAYLRTLSDTPVPLPQN